MSNVQVEPRHTRPTLATRFARHSNVLRSDRPLQEDQMRRAAPSIFAAGKHISRSERYSYIPTIDVLRGLRNEGFEPFMVAQSKSRIVDRTEFTKHLIRMRYVGHLAGQVSTRTEANEIILINSHDGASSYQMLAGAFKFICSNGLVVGEVSNDIRIAHKGQALDEVIDGAFRVLEDFEIVDESIGAMKALTLNAEEGEAFQRAALTLRYGEGSVESGRTPITVEQLGQARRPEDQGRSLWTTLNRTQEHLLRGGLPARTASNRRTHTREVVSIDRSVSLNRALWVLAEEMRRLKG